MQKCEDRHALKIKHIGGAHTGDALGARRYGRAQRPALLCRPGVTHTDSEAREVEPKGKDVSYGHMLIVE